MTDKAFFIYGYSLESEKDDLVSESIRNKRVIQKVVSSRAAYMCICIFEGYMRL